MYGRKKRTDKRSIKTFWNDIAFRGYIIPKKYKLEFVCMEYITMEIKKAEIKDLNIVVKLKMDMFKEVGSIALLQDNAEEQIYEKYKELYQEEKGCHYLVYENDSVIACGGAVIKEDVPFCFFKTPMYGYIIDVYCVPEKRRNGYSSKIMEELLKWLQSKGVHTIKLKPSVAGKHLYEKFGFCDSGEMELWI